jgi:uncharacterized protein YpmS
MRNELIDVDKMWSSFQKKWAKSFFILLALLVGVFIGMTMVRNDIASDCQYLQAFRIGDSSFSCVRKF